MHVVIGVSDRVVAADIGEWLAQQPSLLVDVAANAKALDAIPMPLNKALLIVQGPFKALDDTVRRVLGAGGHVVWIDAPPESEALAGNLRDLSTPFTVAMLEAVFLPILRP